MQTIEFGGRVHQFPDGMEQDAISEALMQYVDMEAQGEDPVSSTAEAEVEKPLEEVDLGSSHEVGPVPRDLQEENNTWSLHPDEAKENIAAEYLDAADTRATLLKLAAGIPKSVTLNAYNPEDGTFGAFGYRKKIHDGLNSKEFYENHPIIGGSPTDRVRENTEISTGTSIATDLAIAGPVWSGVRKASFGLLNKFTKGAELQGKAKLAYNMAGEGMAAGAAGGIAAPEVEDVPVYMAFGAGLGAGVPAVGALYRILSQRLAGKQVDDANEVRLILQDVFQKEATEVNKYLPLDQQVTSYEANIGAYHLTEDILTDAGGTVTDLNRMIGETQATVVKEVEEVKQLSMKMKAFEKIDAEVKTNAPDLEAEAIGEWETLRKFNDPVAMSRDDAENLIEELYDSVNMEQRLADGEDIEHVYTTLFQKLQEHVNTRRINASTDWATVAGRMMLRMDDKLKQLLTPESHALWKQRANDLNDKHDVGNVWSGAEVLEEKTVHMMENPEYVMLFRQTQADNTEKLVEMIHASRANPDNEALRLEAAVQYRRLMDYTEMFQQFRSGSGRTLNAFGANIDAKAPKDIYPDFRYLMDDAADVGQEAVNQVKLANARMETHRMSIRIADDADDMLDDIIAHERIDIAVEADTLAESAESAASKVLKEEKSLEETLEGMADEAETTALKVMDDDLEGVADDIVSSNMEAVTERMKRAVERTKHAEAAVKEHIAELKLETRPDPHLGRSEGKTEGPKTAADTELAKAKEALAAIKKAQRESKELLKKILTDPDVRPAPKKARAPQRVKTLEEQLEEQAKRSEKEMVFTDDEYVPNLEEVTQAGSEAVERTILAAQKAEARVKKLEKMVKKSEDGLSESKPHGPMTQAEMALAQAKEQARKAQVAQRKAHELQKKHDANEKIYPKPVKKGLIKRKADKVVLGAGLKRLGGRKKIESDFDEFLDTYRSGSPMKVESKTASVLNLGVEMGRTSKLSSPITHAWNLGSLVKRVAIDSYVDTFVYASGKFSSNPMRMQRKELQRRHSARWKTIWAELKGEFKDPYNVLQKAVKDAPDYVKGTSMYDMALDLLSTPEKFEEFLKRGLLDPYVATEGTHSKFVHSDFIKDKSGEIFGQKVKEFMETPQTEILWKMLDAYGATNRIASYGVMARMDNLFGKQSYESELQGMLADITHRQGKDKEWSDGIYALVKEYRKSMSTGVPIDRKVTPEVAALVRRLDAQALSRSEDARWMTRLDSDLGKKSQAIASHPLTILAGNVWFNRTPAALMKHIYENNPLMLVPPVSKMLSPKVHADLKGHNGHRKQLERLAHMSYMSAFMGFIWNMAGDGQITGSVRPNEYDVYNAAGQPPNSFNIGTVDQPKWFSHLRMEPFSTVATIVTDIRSIAENARDSDEKFAQNVEDALTSVLFTLISLPMDRIMTKGLGDMLRIAMDSEFQGEQVRRYILNYAGGMLPMGSMGKWITEETDTSEYKKRINTAWDVIKSRYGMSESMITERDILCKPVPKTNSYVGATRIAQQRMDSPIYQKLLELGMDTRPMTKDYEGFEFEHPEYAAIEEKLGDEMDMEQILNDQIPAIEHMPPRQQREILSESISSLRSQAKWEYIQENDDVYERFIEHVGSIEDFMNEMQPEPVDTTNALEVKRSRRFNKRQFKEEAERPFFYE